MKRRKFVASGGIAGAGLLGAAILAPGVLRAAEGARLGAGEYSECRAQQRRRALESHAVLDADEERRRGRAERRPRLSDCVHVWIVQRVSGKICSGGTRTIWLRLGLAAGEGRQ